MHELSITNSIVKISLDAAAKQNAVKIKSIRICYGPFAGIDPECIRMYLELATKGTIAEGAELEAIKIPLKIRCNKCGSENEITREHIFCPKCGGIDVKVLSGREFYVDSLEVDLNGDKSTSSGDGME